MRIKATLGAFASVATLALLGAQPAHAGPTVVATISGAYDLCFYDTPCLVIHNTSGGTLTGATLDLKGYQGLNNGDTAHVDLGDLAPGDSTFIWGFLPGVSGATVAHNLTAYDYDDEWGATSTDPRCTITTSLCSLVGNFKVAFNSTVSGGAFDGEAVGSTFDPSHNFTGGFVPWEGLTEDGLSEAACCDVHSGSITGTLAVITLGTKSFTPEPATWAMMLIGVGMIGARMRRRAAVCA